MFCVLRTGGLSAVLLACLAVGGPVLGQADPATERYMQESADWGRRLDAARSVNENWSADCTTDEVSNVRRCWAGTFSESGEPLHVEYYDGFGPLITILRHDFPGEQPIIRFDNDPSPFRIADDGGVTNRQPQPEIVERMITAQVARARWYEWPDGSEDDEFSMIGFTQAWNRLTELRAGGSSPSDLNPMPERP